MLVVGWLATMTRSIRTYSIHIRRSSLFQLLQFYTVKFINAGRTISQQNHKHAHITGHVTDNTFMRKLFKCTLQAGKQQQPLMCDVLHTFRTMTSRLQSPQTQSRPIKGPAQSSHYQRGSKSSVRWLEANTHIVDIQSQLSTKYTVIGLGLVVCWSSYRSFSDCLDCQSAKRYRQCAITSRPIFTQNV